MKAMILAAGRGERMRPLTDTCPKPLLKVRGRPLIVWHILNLVKAGFKDIVINHAHLGSLIEDTLKDGSQFGARLHYSPEAVALETAGGIAQALPLLTNQGEDRFLVVSGDIYIPHFNFAQCRDVLEDKDMWGNPHPIEKRDMAWLYMVKNPSYHPKGDFLMDIMGLRNIPTEIPTEEITLNKDGNKDKNKNNADTFTFANMGVYRAEMFASISSGQHAKLGPLLKTYADKGQLGGELYTGQWYNVGTPEQLAELNQPLSQSFNQPLLAIQTPHHNQSHE